MAKVIAQYLNGNGVLIELASEEYEKEEKPAVKEMRGWLFKRFIILEPARRIRMVRVWTSIRGLQKNSNTQDFPAENFQNQCNNLVAQWDNWAQQNGFSRLP